MQIQRTSTITKQQVKRVHVLKNILGMDDQTYRDALWEAFGVYSSKNLTADQADGVIKYFENEAAALGLLVNRKAAEKYRKLNGRPDYATAKQLAFIEDLWSKVSRVGKDQQEKSLRTFLQRQSGVSDLRFLKRLDAGKVIEALKAMKQQAGK